MDNQQAEVVEKKGKKVKKPRLERRGNTTVFLRIKEE